MIAIDTNVLLRYLLQDDEQQASKANHLMLEVDEVFITDVVLTETIWTLKGKRYALNRGQIVDVIQALFTEPKVRFEDGHAIWNALKDFKNAKPIKSGGKIKQADFPDALIVNKAMRYGILNDKELSLVYTFDKVALEIKGTKYP